MVIIKTHHVHPSELVYLGDIIISSNLHSTPVTGDITILNYYAAKDNTNNGTTDSGFDSRSGIGTLIQFSAEKDLIISNRFNMINFGHSQTNIIKKTVWFPYLLYRNPHDYTKFRTLQIQPSLFCCFVVKNGNCSIRNDFFNFVSDNYSKVDSLSTVFNNKYDEDISTSSLFDPTYISALSKYKFMICFENESDPFYVTEKIGNAWLAGCIPIYWGMKDIDHIVNKKCFIHVKSRNDFNSALQRIIEIDTNFELYNQMRNQPFFYYNKVPYVFSKKYYTNLINGLPRHDSTTRKRVISYCLYGSDTGNVPVKKYILGAIRNAELSLIYYPDFILYFYIDTVSKYKVDQEIVNKLRSFSHVKIIEIDVSVYPNINFAKCLRFLPMDEPNVEIMLSRDTDSRFSWREANAVREWINSGKQFHIIRDHPCHSNVILGGAWASRKIKHFNWKKEMEVYTNMLNVWDVDQQFLKDKIYPLIKNEECSMIHDNYFKYEKHATNFKDDYIDYSFVGEYVNYNEKDESSHGPEVLYSDSEETLFPIEVRGEEWKMIPRRIGYRP